MYRRRTFSSLLHSFTNYSRIEQTFWAVLLLHIVSQHIHFHFRGIFKLSEMHSSPSALPVPLLLHCSARIPPTFTAADALLYSAPTTPEHPPAGSDCSPTREDIYYHHSPVFFSMQAYAVGSDEVMSQDGRPTVTILLCCKYVLLQETFRESVTTPKYEDRLDNILYRNMTHGDAEIVSNPREVRQSRRQKTLAAEVCGAASACSRAAGS